MYVHPDRACEITFIYQVESDFFFVGFGMYSPIMIVQSNPLCWRIVTWYVSGRNRIAED